MVKPAKFVVFNYVTSKIEQKEVPPNFGDPNRGLQQAASSAYTGSTVGGSSLSSGSVAQGPTPSVLGDPAAGAIAAAQSSLTPAQAQEVSAAFGSIGQLGQLPGTLDAMHAQAMRVIDNPTPIFDAIDTVVKPNEVGSPGRCASLGDFIGSIQGKFNDALTSITSGLSQITNALLGVPLALINSVVTAANALVSAITSGISAVISTAINAVRQVTQGFFNAVGSVVSGLFNTVGGAISSVTDGIAKEVSNLTGVINRVANNTLSLVTPNQCPCLRNVFQASNPDAQRIDVSQIGSLDVDNLSASQREGIAIGAAPSNLSFYDRLFLQFGSDDPNFSAQIIAQRQQRAAALGVSESTLDRADAAAARAYGSRL